MDGLTRNAPPELRPLVQQYGDDLRTQHFDNLTQQRTQRAATEGKQAISSQIEYTTNTLMALARQGGMQTADAQKTMAQLTDYYHALSANPAFGVTKEKADADLAYIGEMGRGDALIGTMDKVFKDQGSVGARNVLQRDLVDNPDLHINDADRAKLLTLGAARIRFLEGQRQTEASVNRQGIDAAVDALKVGKPVDGAVMDLVTQRARDLGDAEGLSKIQQYRLHFDRGGALAAANTISDAARGVLLTGGAPTFDTPIPGSVPRRSAGLNDGYRHIPAVGTAVQFFTSRGYTPEQAAGLVGTLLHESGFRTDARNPGDGTDGSDSIGIAQWNSGRAQALRAYAASKRTAPTDLQTQLEFVDRELNSTHSREGAALRSAKTVEEAARAAIGYEKPKNWSEANPTAGHGYTARLANAQNIAQATIDGYIKTSPAGAGGGAAVAGSGVTTTATLPAAAPMPANVTSPYVLPQYLRALSDNEDLQIAHTRDLAKSVLEGLKHDQLPSVENGAVIMQMGAKFPKQLGETANAIAAQMAGGSLARQIGDLPDDAAQARLAEIHAKASGSSSVFLQQAERAAVDWYSRGQTRMKADPVGEGAARGWYRPIAPLDFTNAGTIAQGLADHGAAAIARAAHSGNAAEPAFGAPELERVKTIATSGPVDQRLALLAGLSQMPDPVRNATLAKLGQSGETAVLAFAGGLAGEAPDVAKSILMGQQAIQADDRYVPSKGPQKEAFAREKDSGLPVSAFPPATRMDPAGPLSAMGQAIDARYAYLAAQAADTSGAVNTTRLRQAASDVTGGILRQNGAPVVAPMRGMTQRDFDGIMTGLSDGDLQGVTTGNGRPITADYVRGSAKLQAVGDGRYLVQINGNDAAPMYAAKDGRAFVLSLKGRQPAAPAQTPRSDDYSLGMGVP